MIVENVKMSWQNILHNRMRSFLTALGIVIGVMAIIALITIVNSVMDSMVSQFTDLGANRLIVNISGTPLKRGLTLNEVASLNDIDGVIGVSPQINFRAHVVSEGRLEDNVAIEGRNEVHFWNNADLIARGRGLNVLDVESRNRVAVINPDLQEILFPGQDPLGQTMRIRGQTFTVVGVTDPDVATDLMGAMPVGGGSSSEGVAMIPYRVAMSMTGTNAVTSLEVVVESTDAIDAVQVEVERVLNQAFNHHENTFFILSMDTVLDMIATMRAMQMTMLIGISSIALLVGGIGIMNMMLVSVTERTMEIGLRKAVGAEPRQIQLQFLIEAVFLSVLGGILGIVLGIIVSLLAIAALDIDFILHIGAILLGFGFSMSVGIVFGWAPARRASRLNPIDALRSI